MKTDSSGIDKQELNRLLKTEYRLDVAGLRFVPGGEESYGYIAQTRSGEHHFVKLLEPTSDLDVRYEAANRLHTKCGLDFVVHPYETKSGKFYTELERYVMSVFDYIDGTVSGQSGFTDEEWKRAARLTAVLHNSVRCPSLPSIPGEKFSIWFEEWLHKVLAAAEDTKPLDAAYAVQARGLLADEKHDILEALSRLRKLKSHVSVLEYEWFLTHGDLKAENFIKGRDGKLYIIDWSKLSIAPSERDLVNFVGERFELFLTEYVQVCGGSSRLHPELFEYYRYFLVLWSIADYGAWLLLENADLIEKKHAWKELQRYLPIDREVIHDEVTRVRQIIEKMCVPPDLA